MNLRIIALTLATLWASVGLASETPDGCLATESISLQRWAEAERILRENLARPPCAGHPVVIYSLAYSIHQQAADAPPRSCEARDLYDEAFPGLADGHPDVFTAAEAHRAEVDRVCGCMPPVSQIRKHRWSRAEAAIERRLADEACAPWWRDLQIARAVVVEQLASETPTRACEARDLYRRLARTSATDARVLKAGERRMGLICAGLIEDCLKVGDEDGNGRADCDDPACRQEAACTDDPRLALESEEDAGRAQATGRGDRTTAVLLTAGAGATAIAAPVLFYLGVQWDTARQNYADEMVRANGAGDQEQVTAAEAGFDRAASRATAYGLSGWASVAIAAGLGVGAALAWADDGAAVTPTVSPTGVGVHIRF